MARARSITFDVADIRTEQSSPCRSGEVLQGLIKPHECAAFGNVYTPRNPLGAPIGLQRGCVRGLLDRSLLLDEPVGRGFLTGPDQ